MIQSIPSFLFYSPSKVALWFVDSIVCRFLWNDEVRGATSISSPARTTTVVEDVDRPRTVLHENSKNREQIAIVRLFACVNEVTGTSSVRPNI